MPPTSAPRAIGPYAVIGRPLGSGGMATVLRVQHAGRTDALKILHLHLNRQPKIVERFRQEFEVGQTMADHPNFLRMYKCEKFDGAWTILMELVEGQTLTKLAQGKLLSPLQAATVVHVLAKAIHDFHARRLVHRDIKPDNIFLANDGTLKIMDYGVARDHDNLMTKTGTTVGTPLFMAPEQLLGLKSIDHRADQYALGLILYRLATRRDPHGASNQTAYPQLLTLRREGRIVQPKAFDPALMAIITRILSPDPLERFPSCLDLAQKLAALPGFPPSPAKAAALSLTCDEAAPQQPRSRRSLPDPESHTQIAPASQLAPTSKISITTVAAILLGILIAVSIALATFLPAADIWQTLRQALG